VAAAAVMFFPIYWMIISAFKSGTDILSADPQWILLRPTLSNFTDAIARPQFGDAVRNSILIVTATVAASLAVAFFAAIAVARFTFVPADAADRADDPAHRHDHPDLSAAQRCRPD
jgi:N,N'-diacetylchitobiose transport system permease protein